MTRLISGEWVRISGPSRACFAALLLVVSPLAAALAQSPAAEQPASEPKSELVAGPVRATLAPIPADTTFAAGNSAFAEITLTTDAAKPSSAAVILEPEGAELQAVEGAPKTASISKGNPTVVTLPSLRKGRAETLLIEVKLRTGGDERPRPETTLNRLRITLRGEDAEAGPSDSTTVSWPVSDCTGNFYDRLAAIREKTGDRMLPAVKAATTPDKTRPGRWLFQNNQPNPTERKLYAFASNFVRHKATDPELRVTRNDGWATNRIATDVTRYLRQEKNPAICSGTIDYVSFFEERLASVRKRAASVAEHAKTARAAARERVALAMEAAKVVSDATSDGRPAEVAPDAAASPPVLEPVAPQPQSETAGTLQEEVARIARLTGDDALLQAVNAAAGAWPALQAMAEALGDRSVRLEGNVRAAAQQALAATELADYLAAVGAQFTELDDTIGGSLSAIGAAHEQSCTCGG